ncbi:MAG: alpha/beta fold hydrolase [Chloroflexota bacterium]
MITRTYQEVYAEAMELYGKHEYGEVYNVLTREAELYPDDATEIIYLRSCMAARQGDNALAIALLREALDKGIWYGEQVMRMSPSWEALQGLPEFEEVAARAKALENEANLSPHLFIQEPAHGSSGDQPRPVVLALHGNNSQGEQTLHGWRALAEQGWLLAAAQSSQALTSNAYIWDNQEVAQREIREHYATLRDGHNVDPSRVLIAGFSMGGETALRAALQGTIPVKGFVLLGPGGPTIDTPDAWLPLLPEAKKRGLRGYIFLGERDDTVPHEEIRKLAALLNEHGIPCELEVVPDIVHDYPADFGPHIARALSFVMD